MAAAILPNQNPDYTHPTISTFSSSALGTLVALTISAWTTITHAVPTQANRDLDGRIQKGLCLGAQDIFTALELNPVIHTVQTLLNFPNTDLAQVDCRAKGHESIVFIPYCLKGKIRDHIIFFAVNTTTREIIFYDSKGWSLADHKLQPVYNKINEQYENYTFTQNLKREQLDNFNCGVYAINRITLLGEHPEMGCQELLKDNPFTFADAMCWRQDKGPIELLSEPNSLVSMPSVSSCSSIESCNDFKEPLE